MFKACAKIHENMGLIRWLKSKNKVVELGIFSAAKYTLVINSEVAVFNYILIQ